MNIVIAGGGAAAAAAAEKCRLLSPDSDITIFSDEAVLPYRRPRLVDLLNKDVLPENFFIRPEKFYKEHNIKIHLQSSVIGIDIAEKRITLLNNRTVNFDRLLLATGAESRKLPFRELNDNVFYLNSFADRQKIKSELDFCRNIAVIGGGVLGLEIAAKLLSCEHNVTLLERNHDLLNGVLDKECSTFLRNKLFTHPRLRIISNCQATGFTKRSSQLCCLLDNSVNRQIPADMAICAIGTRPNNFPGSDSPVVTDEYLRTSYSPDIFAAGSCALVNGKSCEYYIPALRQAETAAANLLCSQTEDMHKYRFPVPEFRCNLDNIKIYCAGNALDPALATETQNDGISLKKLYYRQNHLVGCAMIGEHAATGEIYDTICRNTEKINAPA
ncbi:MAG: FAD-dependent oxidoreductase [Lentisphaeria bacterium]|nr:FAD-dependent oxidoreductase [Lentisphaeria bacterium]